MKNLRETKDFFPCKDKKPFCPFLENKKIFEKF